MTQGRANSKKIGYATNILWHGCKMWNIKTNVKHEVLFEALQAGSEDKAAHSKFTLASLAKKEVFVLMFFFLILNLCFVRFSGPSPPRGNMFFCLLWEYCRSPTDWNVVYLIKGFSSHGRRSSGRPYKYIAIWLSGLTYGTAGCILWKMHLLWNASFVLFWMVH